MEIEIGRGKKGRRAYGLDEIAIVPTRREAVNGVGPGGVAGGPVRAAAWSRGDPLRPAEPLDQPGHLLRRRHPELRAQ